MLKIKKFLFLFMFCLSVFCFFNLSDLLAVPTKDGKFNIGIIKDTNLRQFNQTILGLKSSLSSDLYNMHIIKMDKSYTKAKAKRFIKSKNISLLICLGEIAAVRFAQWEDKVPILFALVLNYKRFKSLSSDNVAGISMEISSQNLFVHFKLLYGGLNKIALPYHPNASSEIVSEAKKAAQYAKIHLETMPIKFAKKISTNLMNKKSKFDSIWMISDFKLYNSSTLSSVKSFFAFAKKYKKPVFVSSDTFLKIGGLFSVSVDYMSLGSQLALLTNKRLKGSKKLKNIKVVFPIGTRTVLNMKVARSLVADGILDEEILYDYEADVFYEMQ